MLTEGQRSLTNACDELARAIRERDYFQSNDWKEVFVAGNDLNMRLRDPQLMERVSALCDEHLERAVAKAEEALKAAQTACKG